MKIERTPKLPEDIRHNCAISWYSEGVLRITKYNCPLLKNSARILLKNSARIVESEWTFRPSEFKCIIDWLRGSDLTPVWAIGENYDVFKYAWTNAAKVYQKSKLDA